MQRSTPAIRGQLLCSLRTRARVGDVLQLRRHQAANSQRCARSKLVCNLACCKRAHRRPNQQARDHGSPRGGHIKANVSRHGTQTCVEHAQVVPCKQTTCSGLAGICRHC